GLRHRTLTIDRDFRDLKRCGHVEDLLAVLDCDDATRRKARAVTTAIDFVHDRMIGIARAQEVRVQRMHAALLDRRVRCRERLPEYLPAEYAAMAGIATLASEEVELEAFQLQYFQQVGEDGIHTFDNRDGVTK